MRVQTFLPVFNGFYNTLFEDILDNATDNAIEYYNEQNYDSFAQYIKDHYTSIDGFISSHSSYASDWMEDLKNDPENETHKVGAVLDFILQEIEEYKDEDLYFDICENYYEIYYTINE